MSFGYIGDTSTSVKQQVKNKGILTTQESFDLERQGFLGGSLELIEEQTFSTSVANIDFTSIQENKYDVHFMSAKVKFGSGNAEYLLLIIPNNSFAKPKVYFLIHCLPDAFISEYVINL